MMTINRREFLKKAAAGGLGVAGSSILNLSLCGQSAAQTAGDFKALVCIVLAGGCDSYHMVLPTDRASWTAYTTTRSVAPALQPQFGTLALSEPGAPPIPHLPANMAARYGGVLPLVGRAASAPAVALNPSLRQMKTRFDAGTVAIVANTGSLIEPLTKTQYEGRTRRTPPQLFSHNDQRNWWMSLSAEGAVNGWGGRLVTPLRSTGVNNFLSAVCIGSSQVFAATEAVPPLIAGLEAVPTLRVNIGSPATQPQALARLAGYTEGESSLLLRDLGLVNRRTDDLETTLRANLPAAGSAPFGTPAAAYVQGNDPMLKFTDPTNGAVTTNNLAQQLQMAARMIKAAQTLGVRRQVLTVNIGGFDTHSRQTQSLATLLAALDHGMHYFASVMEGLGLANSVTTFTVSDFGRTFSINGDGTDHGWGSHQFVMGGAVRGGYVYGSMPTLCARNASTNRFDDSADLTSIHGHMIPTTSVDQFAATMGRWFGADDSTLATAFPYLRNFSTRNLGFMA